MKHHPHPYAWFDARIGQRIYRDSQGMEHDAECPTCRAITEEGVLVVDEHHARYLADIDADFAAEGIFSNYRDVK